MMTIKKKDKFEINITYDGFKSTSSYPNSLKFTGKDLLYAALTCGVYHGGRSYSDKDFLLKRYALESQLTHDKNKNILYSDRDYNMYDPSEKRFLSYYRGMIFTRLVSYKVFYLTYGIHLDLFMKTYHIKKSKKSPDMICWRNKGDWQIWEAKGAKSECKKGEEQVKSIKTINGKTPQKRVVSIAYFSEKELKLYLKDPVEKKEIDLSLDINQMLYFYYTPIVHILNIANYEIKDNMVLREMDINNEKYLIGLPEDIFVSFNDKEKYGKEIELENIVNECSDIKIDGINNDYVYIGEADMDRI